MNHIRESLNKNNNISTEVKDNLMELVNIFNSKFPNVDLQNLQDRLGGLNITSGSKYAYKEISNYNPVNNTLILNMEELQKDYDMKHIMMCATLDMITAKDNMVGFNKDKNLVALNTGYREILVNNLVGNDSNIEYHTDEIIMTNLIANMIGNDIMFKSYFTNDENLITTVLENAGLMDKIIPDMNFNYYNQNSSNLAQTLLELEKISLNNGTYQQMAELFEREIPSSKCFSDDNHKEIDNFITFNKNMKKAIRPIEVEDNSLEEIHNIKM